MMLRMDGNGERTPIYEVTVDSIKDWHISNSMVSIIKALLNS